MEVPSWPSEVEVVGLPSSVWVVEVPSWPSEVEVVEPSYPLVEGGVEEVEEVSSPWLTPHANTESL